MSLPAPQHETESPVVADHPASTNSPPSVRSNGRSRRRRWCFRVLAVSFPFLLLAVVEMGLRWAGVGKPLGLLSRLDSGGPADGWRFNPDVDLAFYGATNLSGPEPRPFLVPKPNGTFRIVVVGGSTVVGFPYPSELAFPRLLEVILRRQELPVEVEVLNAGITAINSFAEADLVRQSIDAKPDLIIVYTGHNEFVGPGGVGSRGGELTPALAPLMFAIRRTRFHQALARWLRRASENERDDRQLIESLPGDLQIPWNGPKFQRAEECFRKNLERMVGYARAAHVPLLLTTPVSNLRDQSPMESLSQGDLTRAERAQWDEAFARGIERLAAGAPGLARAEFSAAAALDDGHALLAYRQGQAFEQLGEVEEARRAYERARDLDACRFRAPGAFGRIVGEVAAAASGDDVRFLDTAQAFAQSLPDGIPGAESFLEHVHFTSAGNWRIATLIAAEVVSRIPGGAWRPELVPGPEARDALAGAIVQDEMVARSLILIMLERPPLNQGPDVAQQQSTLREEIKALLTRLSPAEQALFAELSLESMERDLIGALLPKYSQAGLRDAETGLLRQGVLRRPWRTDFLLNLAERELSAREFDSARTLVDQAKRWKADSPWADRLLEQIEQGSPAATRH